MFDVYVVTVFGAVNVGRMGAQEAAARVRGESSAWVVRGGMRARVEHGSVVAVEQWVSESPVMRRRVKWVQ